MGQIDKLPHRFDDLVGDPRYDSHYFTLTDSNRPGKVVLEDAHNVLGDVRETGQGFIDAAVIPVVVEAEEVREEIIALLDHTLNDEELLELCRVGITAHEFRPPTELAA